MRVSDFDIQRARAGAHRARRATPHSVEILARAGYAAKGVVYALIGVLALMAAFGTGGGQVGGPQTAIQTIGSQPFGTFLLALTGIGLAGYAIWRFVQAALDPEHAGSDAKGIAKRLGYTGSGLMHGALAIAALQMAFGSGSGQSGQQTYVAKLMGEPFGQLIVGAIGVFVIGAGLYQLYKAYTAKFMRDLSTQSMSATERTWAERLGRLGYAARGVVFPIIGFFLVKAAVTYQPGQSKDLGGALATLSAQTYGTILLIVVAAGLVAYAVYQFVEAKYRRIPAA